MSFGVSFFLGLSSVRGRDERSDASKRDETKRELTPFLPSLRSLQAHASSLPTTRLDLLGAGDGSGGVYLMLDRSSLDFSRRVVREPPVISRRKVSHLAFYKRFSLRPCLQQQSVRGEHKELASFSRTRFDSTRRRPSPSLTFLFPPHVPPTTSRSSSTIQTQNCLLRSSALSERV